MSNCQERHDDGASQPAVVRLRKPKAILLAFHGTISPTDWEELVIFPYVRNNLLAYLTENHENNKPLWKLIDVLRRLSFYDRFILEKVNAPVITALDTTGKNIQQVFKTTIDYVMWKLDQPNTASQAIELLCFCWEHGYRNQKLQTIIFPDVLPAILRWKKMDIKVCIYTAMQQEKCRLVLSSTTAGDVASNLDHIFNGDNAGPRRNKESYDRIAATLNLAKSDMLFICDYGQDVKTANEAGLQVVLFYRPGNKRNRSYYHIRYPNAITMEAIEFV